MQERGKEEGEKRGGKRKGRASFLLCLVGWFPSVLGLQRVGDKRTESQGVALGLKPAGGQSRIYRVLWQPLQGGTVETGTVCTPSGLITALFKSGRTWEPTDGCRLWLGSDCRASQGCTDPTSQRLCRVQLPRWISPTLVISFKALSRNVS